jgi:hypothetical protein
MPSLHRADFHPSGCSGRRRGRPSPAKPIFFFLKVAAALACHRGGRGEDEDEDEDSGPWNSLLGRSWLNPPPSFPMDERRPIADDQLPAQSAQPPFRPPPWFKVCWRGGF